MALRSETPSQVDDVVSAHSSKGTVRRMVQEEFSSQVQQDADLKRKRERQADAVDSVNPTMVEDLWKYASGSGSTKQKRTDARRSLRILDRVTAVQSSGLRVSGISERDEQAD